MNQEPQRLKCPRCQLLLQEQEYEGNPVQFCGTCWGYWLTAEALNHIIEDHRYHFSRSERKTILQVMADQVQSMGASPEDARIDCPVCGRQMERKRWIEECPVEVDQCAEHGVWLDPGEIKELQVFAESR